MNTEHNESRPSDSEDNILKSSNLPETLEDIESKPSNSNLKRQAIFYFIFALFMVLLNMLIQYLHEIWLLPFISTNLGHFQIIQRWYLSTDPYNMPELIGSAIAVVITYITKFILDKYIVFEKKEKDLKQTSKQFIIYLGLAIITTMENLGIQFLLENITPWPLWSRITIALICGYITKFFLDRKFCFQCN